MTYDRSWDGVFNPGKADNFFWLGGMPFQVDKRDFSAINGWWLAEMSRLIYLRGGRNCSGHEQTARNRFLHRAGLEETWYYNGRYVQCAIIRSLPGRGEPLSVLVFRGTRRGVSNWLFLLNLIMADWPAGGKVHGGFKRVLLNAWEHIHPEIEAISSPIFYTGHSLGGALAVLAATLAEPAAVYTFGCPKFVDSEFLIKTRHLRIHRVVNPTDIVVAIPPLPGVVHVGDPHLLKDVKPSGLSSSSSSTLSILEPPAFLADHSPANYSFRLNRIHQEDVAGEPQDIRAMYPEC